MNEVYFIKFDRISNRNDFLNVKNEINIYNPEIIVWDCIREYDIFASEFVEEFNSFLIEKNIIIYVFLGVEKQKSLLEKYEKFKMFKFIFIAQYFFNSIYHTQFDIYSIIKKDIDKRIYDKLYICLNHNIKYHRSMTIDKLCENNLLELGTISWLLEDKTYDFKCWKQDIIQIDNTNEYDTGVNQHWLASNFGNPFINLVTETLYDKYFFMTEKVVKPLLLGQLFLVVSTKNFHCNLKKYGFELYDEIFDYDFDNEESIEKRIEGVINNLLRIKDMDYSVLYEKTKDKVEKNINRAIQIIEENTFIPQEFYVLYKKYKSHFDSAIENGDLKNFYF